MRISQAETLKKTDGLTLLEFIIVAFLLSLAISFVGIRWNTAFKETKDTLLERISVEIALLKELSISEYRQKAMEIDFSTNRIMIGEIDGIYGFMPSKPFNMPEKYMLKDVVINGEKFTIGKAYIRIYPTGLVDKVIFHFEGEKEGFFSIKINPLTAKASEENGYVEEIQISLPGRVNPT
ncbi:MAG: hypothetical protein N2745_07995 [Syntrophorhabdaceae bacterium]|nr:hypothetical protein [Syntrophorhabdaceae bacterium]